MYGPETWNGIELHKISMNRSGIEPDESELPPTTKKVIPYFNTFSNLLLTDPFRSARNATGSKWEIQWYSAVKITTAAFQLGRLATGKMNNK